MALINCPECGHRVSDVAEVCPECGYPIAKMMTEKRIDTVDENEIDAIEEGEIIEDDKKYEDQEGKASKEMPEKEAKKKPEADSVLVENPKSNNITAGIALLVIVLIGFVAWYFITADSRAYNSGVKLMEQEDYINALKKFNSAKDYKDSKEKIAECEKLYMIQNDKTAPTIEGLSDGYVIEVSYGSDFNLNDYLYKTLTVSDDITEGPIYYDIDCDSYVYDSNSGSIDTSAVGEYPIGISAKDEAGNESQLFIILKIKSKGGVVTADPESVKRFLEQYEKQSE